MASSKVFSRRSPGRLDRADDARVLQRSREPGEATIVTAKREDFRIVHMSIQRDHVHLIVEAESKTTLSRGVRGFSISAARQINRAITARCGDRGTGKVIADRFHARPLTCPRAVRNTLAYVLSNWRHHGEDQAGAGRTWKVDPFSRRPLFFDWKELEGAPFLWPLRPTYHPLIVLRPRTWLLRSASSAPRDASMALDELVELVDGVALAAAL